MYPGMLIIYKVSPMAGIPLTWITEIKYIKEMEYFIDDQLSGPFALWNHQHRFAASGNGTLMTDVLTYALPLGFLGSIAHSLFVKKQVQGIFDYRAQQLKQLFG